MANEILYVLDAANEHSNGLISKLALQKYLYLSGALAPIKDVILSFLHFSYEQRGPYSKDIQNTIDHLVAIGLADIVSFKEGNRYALANYKISEAGIEAVKLLREYFFEDDKHWWINVVIQLALTYMYAEGLDGDSDERIMKLVYQDPSFKQLKENNKYHYPIDLDSQEGITFQLIQFIKKYIKEKKLIISKDNERRNVEILLVVFFEHLYANYLSEVEK